MVCKSDGNHKDTISYFNNVVVCCFHESLNQKTHSGVFFIQGVININFLLTMTIHN